MSKAYLRAAAPAAFVFLGACGGGGSSSTQPIPPPPVSASAFPLTKSGSFDTISASRSYHNDGNGNTAFDSFGVAARGSNVSISYDASTNSYTVKNGAVSASFNSSNLTTNGFIDTYTSSSTMPIYDRLTLYNNVRSGTSQADAPVKLSYLSYGAWTHNDFSTSDEYSKTYLLFGYPTADSNMPKTGSASYTVAVMGNRVGPTFGGAESNVGGTADFSADFGNGIVTTALTLHELGSGTMLGLFNGNAQISGNQFTGIVTSNSPTFREGTFVGGFFGPSAAEVGYTFDITDNNALITGAVVGTKN